MNAIAKELARQAKKAGICEEWYGQLKLLTDKGAMIDMYIRGIDFCLSNDYPSNDYIREHFKGAMEKKGVYLDDEVMLSNPRRCVALGRTVGSVVVGGYGVCEVFVKHDSVLVISASDNAFVEIDMFDNSEVSVHTTERAKVHINRYGGRLTTDQRGDSVIKVVEKDRKTY